MKRLTDIEFITHCNKIHNSKYNYDLVSFRGLNSSIDIICPTHGVFQQRANDHKRGSGCKQCAWDSYRMTSEKFIEKSKSIFGDIYDYSLVQYGSDNTHAVKIICDVHGVFKMTPNAHLLGYNCPKCAHKQLTTQQFIMKAHTVHNDRYNYELSTYKGHKSPLVIICYIHGEFLQRPVEHLAGSGCNQCNIDSMKYDSITFIEKANVKHRNCFDYSLVEYISGKDKVRIICNRHGIFLQEPSNHLSGQGCPSCKESHGEKLIRNALDANNASFRSQYRISGCKYKRSLPFDFAVFDNGILISLIEYQGEHHYFPIKRGSKMTDSKADTIFERQQEKDRIKADYCCTHNIPLLIIPYWEKNEIAAIIKNIKLNNNKE